MKKDFLRGALAVVTVVVLYLLIVFLIPFSKTATFWVSFGFTLASFAVGSVAIYIAFARTPGIKSKFYGFPIARIGVIYGAFQLLAGIAFMAVGMWIPYWVAVLVFAVALGAATIGLIGAESVMSEIAEQDKALSEKVALMRSLISKAGQISLSCENEEIKAEIDALADEMKYSDPVSSEALAEIEGELGLTLDQLYGAVLDNDSESAMVLCDQAKAQLIERNRLCMLNK